MATSTSHNTAYRQQLSLLYRLHLEMKEGRGESAEADRLRGEMDLYWSGLSAAEIAHVEGLSADLYTIGVNRDVAGSNVPQSFAEEMKSLTEKNAWHEILDHVRAEAPNLSPRDVAYARGLCWAHQGEPDIAIEFLNEAARLRSLTAAEEFLLLTCYLHANRGIDAIPRAKRIRAEEENPLLLIKAVEVFSMAAEESEEVDAAEYRRAAVDCGERGFALISAVRIAPENRSAFESMAVPPCLHLALSYAELGQHAKAVEACKKALEIAPDNPDALMLYGFLTFNEFPISRKSQFIGRFHNRLSADASLVSQLN